MISGNITFTNTNLCYETCFTMQDYFKVKTDLSNIIRVFAFCAVEKSRELIKAISVYGTHSPGSLKRSSIHWSHHLPPQKRSSCVTYILVPLRPLD